MTKVSQVFVFGLMYKLCSAFCFVLILIAKITYMLLLGKFMCRADWRFILEKHDMPVCVHLCQRNAKYQP